MSVVYRPVRSLGRMRRNAPPQDLNTEALALPSNDPYRFIKRATPSGYPSEALDALRVVAGPYGEAAIEEAKWSAIGLWLLSNQAAPLLTNPLEVAQATHRFCREARRMSAGWPTLSNRPYSSMLLGQSAATIAAAWDVCAETLADWERARSPRLMGAIRRTSQYIRKVLQTKPAGALNS